MAHQNGGESTGEQQIKIGPPHSPATSWRTTYSHFSIAHQNNESVLRKTQLFASLTEGEMHTLCACVSKQHFGCGETLFSEGDQCRGLFVVAAGRIRIFKLFASGREQVLEGPGSSFAELPVFDGGVYPASASTLEGCRSALHLTQSTNLCRLPVADR